MLGLVGLYRIPIAPIDMPSYSTDVAQLNVLEGIGFIRAGWGPRHPRMHPSVHPPIGRAGLGRPSPMDRFVAPA